MLVQRLRLAAQGDNIRIRVEAGGVHANTHLAWIGAAGPLAQLLVQEGIDIHLNKIVPFGRPRYREHFQAKYSLLYSTWRSIFRYSLVSEKGLRQSRHAPLT